MSPVFNNTLIGSSGQSVSTIDYPISASVRFNSADSSHFTFTPSTVGNRRTWTWACWVKRGSLGSFQRIFNVYSGASGNDAAIRFTDTDNIQFASTVNTSQFNIITTSVYRDCSAWYHIVVSCNTNNVTSTDRLKIYVNGVRVTSFSTTTYPSQSIEGAFNNVVPHWFGQSGASTEYLNGYLADSYFIDGLELEPTAFGETDLNGIWQPKEYEGLFVGNSFHLPFSDTSSNTATTLGKNTSGIGTIAYNPITSSTGAQPIYNTTDIFGRTKGVGTRVDPFASSLVLAMPLDNANDYSATIKGSGVNKTVTNNSVSFTNSFSQFYGQSAGAFSRAATSYLTVPDSADLEFGSDNFTFEVWVYLTNSTQHYEGIISKPGNGDQQGFLFYKESSNNQITALLANSSGAWAVTLNFGLSTDLVGKWNHYAVVRNGNVFTGYLNGVSIGSVTAAISIFDNGNPWQIGRYTQFPVGVTLGFDGYLQDFRIYKGVAKYTTNFYPSEPAGGLPIHNTTDDFGVVKGSGTRTDSFASNLVLALPMDGATGSTTFSDLSATIKGSGSNKTATRYGNSVISNSSSRFYGTSGYFDGTGDYLEYAYSSDWDLGNGDFTIEAFVNVRDTSDYPAVVGRWLGTGTACWDFRSKSVDGGNNFCFIYTTDGNTAIVVNSGVYVSDSRWRHLAVSRKGSYLNMFVNGNLVHTHNIGTSTIFNSASTPLYVGYDPRGSSYISGYLQDVRIYKGIAKYTSSFIPPERKDYTPVNLTVSTGGPTSLSATTAALPILNTTGTYGQTLDTGVRSDPFAANLVYAVAGGTSAGLNITDQVPTGRTAAALTITAGAGVSSTTASSQYYGGSARLSGNSSSNITSSTSSDLAFLSSDYTIECWVKRNGAGLQAFETIIDTRPVDTTDMPVFGMNANNEIKTYGFPAGFGDTTYTNAYVRVGGWNHLALVKSGINHYIFCNGVMIYSTTSTNNPTTTSTRITVGDSNSVVSLRYTFNGDVQDVRIYKGLAKYTSNFTVPSSTQFPAVAAIGDSFEDSPTNYGLDTGLGGEVRGNYCTMNPNDKGSLITVSDGNLRVTASNTTSPYHSIRGTIGVSSGKWYWEVTATNEAGASPTIGIANAAHSITTYVGWDSGSWGLQTNSGNKFRNQSGTSYGSALATGDIVMVALDMDNGKIWWGKNGTWFASGNPATGVNEAFSGITGTIFPAQFTFAGAIYTYNFGQRPFAYSAPSGFKCLCTQNLVTPSITDGSTGMDVVSYSGNGSSQSITGLKFTPGLFWGKSRNNAYFHNLIDIIRGGSLRLSSNNTGVEDNGSAGGATPLISTFNADGVTFPNANLNTNDASTTYVAWMWNAGTSTVTNTSGTIQSQVRANPSVGISVVTYSGNSTVSATVGHGLNTTPSMIIFKRRNAAQDWGVYHTSGGLKLLQLNTGNPWWNNASNYWYSLPTSTVFYPDNTNGDNYQNVSGGTYVAYCFAQVAGFSSFGTYTGNGSADGPFVYTGFRPRWVLWKKVSVSTNVQWWSLFDTKRIGANNLNYRIHPNVANQEATDSGGVVDILSNGFKLRSNDVFENESAATYIYAAFAENPFKIARAR
jgi:hypothetical protein